MGCELNKNGLKIDTINRQNRRGGGLAIIFRNDIKVKRTKSGAKTSFEYALWKINLKNVTTSVLAIYRPPYSESHKVNVKTFCEEFTDFLTDIIASEKIT